MLEYFLCLFFVNALVALIHWYLINQTFEKQLKSAADRFTSFWDEQVSKFETVSATINV